MSLLMMFSDIYDIDNDDSSCDVSENEFRT